MDANFHLSAADPRPRADRRRNFKADRDYAWLTRNMKRHRPPASAGYRTSAVARSKYMPHIGAKQRAKGAARLASE